MKCYKNLSPDGILKSIGTGMGGTEITEAEYFAERSTIRAKVEWVNKVWNGSATLEDVPSEWREEVERRVSERVAAAEADPEVSDEDAFAELMGVLSE